MRSRVWYEMRNGAHNGGFTRLCNEHQMKLEMNKCIRGAACKEEKKNKTPAQPLESCKWNVAINLLDGKIKLSLLFHFCAHVEQNIKLCYRNMAYVWLIKQLQTFLVGNEWILMCTAQIITPLHNNWATNLLSKYKKKL